MPDYPQSFKVEAAGTLTVAANKDRWVAPRAGQVTAVTAVVGTAPTGAAAIFDVLKNGVSVFGANAKPTVAVSTTVAPRAAAPDSALAKFAAGDVLSLSVTQIGSTVAGSDADVVVEYVFS